MKKSKIYTRTGDAGTTSLVSGNRVKKNNIRLEAYGSVDELNSFLGLLCVHLQDEEDKATIFYIQNKLFSVGAYLATDQEVSDLKLGSEIYDKDIERLERAIDECDALLPPLKAFVLPGGSEPSALAHVCRTVCRRVERNIVALAEEVVVCQKMTTFINRLSDYLFILSRKQNKLQNRNEIFWDKCL